MRWHTLILLTVGLLIAADEPKDDPARQDLKTFQGTWVLVSAGRDGKKVPEGQGVKLQIEGNK
jgi:hypothetical protein